MEKASNIDSVIGSKEWRKEIMSEEAVKAKQQNGN